MLISIWVLRLIPAAVSWEEFLIEWMMSLCERELLSEMMEG